MKIPLLLSALTAILAAQNRTMVGENTVQVSEHGWAIMGFPNIAVIAGSRATLVVDTGLGPRNGATAARIAAKLAPANQKLFLTTTHFHPEHAAGEAGSPPAPYPDPQFRPAARNGSARQRDGRPLLPPLGAK